MDWLRKMLWDFLQVKMTTPEEMARLNGEAHDRTLKLANQRTREALQALIGQMHEHDALNYEQRLRDQFAMSALVAVMARPEGTTGLVEWAQRLDAGILEHIVSVAYRYADAALIVRKRKL